MKVLDAAATPGPWENNHHAKRFGGGYTFGPDGEMVADKCGGCDGVRLRGVGGHLPQEQNGDFIAEARTLLPRAVAQIERLQSRVCGTCRHGRVDVSGVTACAEWGMVQSGQYSTLYYPPYQPFGCTAHEPKESR